MDRDGLRLLRQDIDGWGAELGFQQVAVADTDLEAYRPALEAWLDAGYHGAMGYMARNHEKRCRPEVLLPGTVRAIVVRMDYSIVNNGVDGRADKRGRAYIARYARGRDYHRLMRRRLQSLAHRIEARAGPFGYRVFVDSAPVLERALAEKAGLGWIGKNTMLINRDAGSWFFLGEILTDLPLPVDPPPPPRQERQEGHPARQPARQPTQQKERKEQESGHCGSCTACLDLCPTKAFVKPGQLDATRCISYLTIELRTSIPEELRPLMGNRVFGCDDCQLVCPWNKFSRPSREADFAPRHGLDDAGLVDLFAWSEAEFLSNTAGSPIRRIGYDCWLRNLAVGLGNAAGAGNAAGSPAIIAALEARKDHPSAMVREHVHWALAQHGAKV